MKRKRCTFSVKGLHCASCEILVEKKLLKQKNISYADASVKSGIVEIEYNGAKPKLNKLNKIFKNEDYRFQSSKSNTVTNRNWLIKLENGCFFSWIFTKLF